MSTKKMLVLVGIVVYAILHMVPIWTPGINATLLFGWWPFESLYRVILLLPVGVLWAWLLVSWFMPKDASEAIRPAEEEKTKGGAE